MKVDKKGELKFRNTENGKKMFFVNIVAGILYLVSFFMLVIVILNEGHELNGLLIGIIIMAFILCLVATLMCTAYYYSLQQYLKENKKNKNRKG